MSCFTTMTAVTAGADLDLTKHVNYTAGMILGVDDFTQEFAYLAGRNRWLARDAVGYGTISGLSVRAEKDGEGWRVMVSPGVAISPRGQLICVSTAQCAYLNQWLAAADPGELENKINGNVSSPSSGGEKLNLYVVLCYRDCPTDNAPIPGEPCRNESELSAASRIKDDFSLELRFEPPKHAEEDAVKKFAAWLKEIEIVESGASTDLEDFIQAIRNEWLSPSSPPVTTSPPTVLQINKDEICEYMRAAFRLWVTELRTVLSERKTGCSVEMTGGGKLEDCVLLAELNIPLISVSPNWEVSDAEDVLVNEENRPFLMHLRMLQEWILCGCSCPAEEIVTSPPFTSPPIVSPPVISPPIVSPPVTSPPVVTAHDHSLDSLSDVTVPAPSDGQILIFRSGEWVAEDPETTAPLPAALDDLTDVTVPSPAEGQILIFKSGEWIAETPTEGGVTDHGALNGLNDDDHPQYLLVNGSRAMSGNLLMGGNQIRNIAAGTANGQAVIFQQAVKQNDAAGGDLGGKYPNPSVVKLQGKDVGNQNPNTGDALVWNGTAWIPQPINQTAENPFIILPIATVTRLGDLGYQIWFNIDAPGNLAEIKELTTNVLQILDETDSPVPFLRKVRFSINPAGVRNVFTVRLSLEPNQMEPNFMRFNFNVNKIRVSDQTNDFSLLEYADKNGIKFTGYLKGELATVFVRGTGGRDI